MDKNSGKVYSDPDNPWVQEVRAVSRLQYQSAYVDGEAGGMITQHIDNQ